MKRHNRVHAYMTGLRDVSAARAVMSRPASADDDVYGSPYRNPILAGDYDSGCHDRMRVHEGHRSFERGFGIALRRKRREFERMIEETHR